MSVTILYTDYSKSIYERLLKTYNSVIPEEVKEKAFKFKNWQDRQAFLIGKLLIWKGLKRLNYKDDCLLKMQFNSYGKPFIDEHTFFNVSHSGNIVVCAFCDGEVGIDVEEIKEIDTDDFIRIFSEREQYYLKNSLNQLNDFFRFWSIKESVIKAEGKGLSIPLQLIDASEKGKIQYGNKIWHITELTLFSNYCCSLATIENAPPVVIEKIDLEIEIIERSEQ